jgi:hypothetical protein
MSGRKVDQVQPLKPHGRIAHVDESFLGQSVKLRPFGLFVARVGVLQQPTGHQMRQLVTIQGDADIGRVLASGRLLVAAVGTVVTHRQVEQDFDQLVGFSLRAGSRPARSH